jgi:hypothetical protein
MFPARNFSVSVCAQRPIASDVLKARVLIGDDWP